jgi:hypothetical protein
MNQLREEFDATMTPPPSTLDIDQLVAGGRRASRRRTLAVTAGAAGMVAGAATLFMLLSTVTPATLPTGPGRSAVSATYSSEVLARLNAAGLTAISRATNADRVAGASTPNWPSFQAIAECAKGSPAAGDFCGGVRYDLEYKVASGSRDFPVHLTVGTAPTFPQRCLEDTAGQVSPDPQCQVSEAHGMRIFDLATDVVLDQPAGTDTLHVLTAVHPDGTVVQTSLRHRSDSGYLGLTTEQAVQIITDPALTLFA